MSLPTSVDLPIRSDYDEKKDLEKYNRDFVFSLQTMYQKIADNVNGYIRNDAETDQSQWLPTLAGTTAAGVFTYSLQAGYSVRQGIFTKIYFDIQWTATTAAGNLYIELPYRVCISNGHPFIGILQPSNITFGAGYSNLVVNAIPNTYRGEIWRTGSNVAANNLTVPATGRLTGFLDYIGTDEE